MSKTHANVHRCGSSMFEGLIALCVLLYVCLVMMQIFQWVANQMISEYSSFYGTKALSLGYASENCRKATRIAAMGMSGTDISNGDRRVALGVNSPKYHLRIQATRYMRMGEGSGVNYEYWQPQHSDKSTQLSMPMNPYGPRTICTVKLDQPTLLTPSLARILNLSQSSSCQGNIPDAESTHRMFNYAATFLDE